MTYQNGQHIHWLEYGDGRAHECVFIGAHPGKTGMCLVFMPERCGQKNAVREIPESYLRD